MFTRRQIGEALGYNEPRKAIENIHTRHKEELDKFKGVLTVRTPGGKQEVVCYNLVGTMRICIYSSQRRAKAECLEANLNSAHASYKAEKAENKRLATIAGLESTKEGRTARAFHDALKMAVVEGGYRLDKMRSQSVDRASRQCIGVYDKEYLYMPLELMQWVYNQYAPDETSCFTLRADLEKAGVMAKKTLGKSYGRTINGKKEDCERILIRYVDDIISIRL